MTTSQTGRDPHAGNLLLPAGTPRACDLLSFFDFPGLDVGPYAEVLSGQHVSPQYEHLSAEVGNDGQPARRPGRQGSQVTSELVHQTSDVLLARTAFLSGDEHPPAVRPGLLSPRPGQGPVRRSGPVPQPPITIPRAPHCPPAAQRVGARKRFGHRDTARLAMPRHRPSRRRRRWYRAAAAVVTVAESGRRSQDGPVPCTMASRPSRSSPHGLQERRCAAMPDTAPAPERPPPPDRRRRAASRLPQRIPRRADLSAGTGPARSSRS